MTDTKPPLDARILATRDILLAIIRSPYNEAITIHTKPDDADKFVGRLRTALTRVKGRLTSQGREPKPLTITVVSIGRDLEYDELVLRKQKQRGAFEDPLGDLVDELGMKPAQGIAT